MAKLAVTVYTMTDCPFCAKAKEILADMGVTYKEKNVLEDRKYIKELMTKTKDNKLPTVIINDVILIKPGEDKLRATINFESHR